LQQTEEEKLQKKDFLLLPSKDPSLWVSIGTNAPAPAAGTLTLLRQGTPEEQPWGRGGRGHSL